MFNYINNKDEFDEDILKMQSKLCKLGYLKSKFINGVYSLETEKAIKDLQRDKGFTVDGKISENILRVMDSPKISNNTSLGKYNRSLYVNENVRSDGSQGEETIDKQEPYFNDKKENELRKSTVNIKIKYAETGWTIIEDVSFRSINRRMDSSGEAIYEIYEFIGRDLLE